MEIEELKKSVEENTQKIVANMEQIQKNSGALEILRDFKGDNKRLFAILIIILFMWFSTIVYLVYVLNDVGTIETTQEITDLENIENTNIINGGNYGES